MGKTVCTNVKNELFGNCIKLTNDIVELLVTVDYGPRVIWFSRVGMDNMLYQDKEMSELGEKQEVFDETLKLIGGHRIWISPEILPRCYYPDSKPVEYKEVENGMEFTAPVETVNNIQKILTITLAPDKPYVCLDHTIKNCGVWEIELAPWCITMTDKGGKQVIPMPSRTTGLLPNRNLTLWDYSVMNDKRVYWGKDYITLTQDKDATTPFKVGLNNEDGWSALFNKGQLFIKYFDVNADGYYPDNGCSYETYTNAAMMETESLGEFVMLNPGDSVLHTEEWEIYEENRVPSNDEKEIKALMSEYIDK